MEPLRNSSFLLGILHNNTNLLEWLVDRKFLKVIPIALFMTIQNLSNAVKIHLGDAKGRK